MKITMKEIARIHGVSVNAVSLALNNKPGVSEEMRAAILKTAKDTGYLDTKEKFVRTYARTNICVMMQQMYAQDIEFYGQVLMAVVDEAKRSGYETVLHFFDDDDLDIPPAVKNRHVSGVIILGKIKDAHIAALKAQDMPVVLADHRSLAENVDCIVTNNLLGSYTITRYLIDKGFKHIGFFGELTYSLSVQERYDGYRQAVTSHLPIEAGKALEDYVRTYCLLDGIEQAVITNNIRGIYRLLKQHATMPEAFVCSNDKAAISLIVALQSLGYRVPEDIAVVGFDNIALSEHIRPTLTTVNVNKRLMGKRAVQRLLHIIFHRNSLPEQLAIGVELIERDSVAGT